MVASSPWQFRASRGKPNGYSVTICLQCKSGVHPTPTQVWKYTQTEIDCTPFLVKTSFVSPTITFVAGDQYPVSSDWTSFFTNAATVDSNAVDNAFLLTNCPI